MRSALAVLLSLALVAPAAAGSEEEVYEKAFSMEGASRVSVENVNGGIEANAWDRPYLRVRAVKSGSQAAVRETRIRVRKLGDQIKIETINPSRRRLFGFLELGSRKSRVDYELEIPASVGTHLETCNGKVEAAGLSGALSADSVNGSIDLRGVGGPVKATTVNGSVRVVFKGLLRKTRLETVNGSVEAAFDRNSSFRYDLETVNGRIEANFDLTVEGKWGPKQARGSYNGANQSLHCETVNGSIRLKANP